MADLIGVTTSLISVANFAFQISKELYHFVESVQYAPQAIRNLKVELADLDPILNSIQKVITNDASQFEDIRCPLQQCGMVCFHLKSLLQKTTEHSGSGRSAQDWAKMRYRRKTIDRYIDQLASYKATIKIALRIHTLPSSTSSAEVVEELKVTINDAIGQALADLEVQIDQINEDLESLAIENEALIEAPHNHSIGSTSTSTQTLQEKQRALEEDRLALEVEKKAMEQCQRVCTASKEFIANKNGHKFIATGYTVDREDGKHFYQDIHVRQNVKVLYGHNYGGKSIFD